MTFGESGNIKEERKKKIVRLRKTQKFRRKALEIGPFAFIVKQESDKISVFYDLNY